MPKSNFALGLKIISYQDFGTVDIRVGTIISAQENLTLKKPSIVLEIDFGKKTNKDKIDPIVDGGRLHGVVCHYVDLICYLVGQNIINVNSFSMSNKNFDTINVLLQFEDFSFSNL